MSPAVISIIIEDWMKSLFLINILLDKEKMSSLNISILINTNYQFIIVIDY